MNITKKQLRRIIKEEVSKLLSEAMEVPEGEDVLDMIYDSRPGDLIYYGISGLNKMKDIVEKEIIETEQEYNIFHYGDMNWAADNIVPLQEMYDKIIEAMKIAVDMGFGES
jgi:hypothetical protein